MSIENDETLQVFIDESLEHLSDIENDFLAIEEAGADIDEELVNKVYRAAHSIKGGAGFMGLTNIKDLTHEMENILGKIRSREMIPNPEIVNIMLLASDALRDLINNISASNETDVSEHIEALRSIAQAGFSEDEEASVEEMEEEGGSAQMIDLSFPDGEPAFIVSQEEISGVREEGKYIYLIKIDLIRDLHIKERMPINLIDEMQQTGIIMNSKVGIDAVGFLDKERPPEEIPFTALFASILKPEDINALFEVDKNLIYEVAEDLTVESIAGPDHLEPDKDEDYHGREKSLIEEPTYIDKPEKKIAMDIKNEQQLTEGSKTAVAVDTSIRVQVSLLDSLMTLAGELVLGRNQLIQSLSSKDKSALENSGQRIDLITSELQEAIMLTRMQPVGNVFNKFPRVVRDLSRNLGKKVNLSLEGNDVELDKTIIESINDPLTHLVRNSVDHGIEIPDERIRGGKSPEGKVVLRAYHEAGQVNIEIMDDGKGLDGDKLATAAVSKGLITEDQAGMMSDKEKVGLIFMPGFSTAEKVTDVSGRGVGMDVVKTNLDMLGGVVDIDSQVGEGTTIRIKLPLTLAIIPTQIISTGKERYAIPQVNMEELIRIPADQVKHRIERVGDADVVRLRGNLLPLVKLADVIGSKQTYFDTGKQGIKEDRRERISDRRSGKDNQPADESAPNIPDLSDIRHFIPRETADRRYHAGSAVNVVVVSAGSLKYGLVVEELHDSEEIVVKPLGYHLKHCKGYAGATIMGDGRVALILDVIGLSRMANLASMEGTKRSEEVEGKAGEESDNERLSLLLFRSGEDEQFAVPLNLVARIEKTDRKDVENVGGKKVMKCRGQSLPLIAIDDVASVQPLAEREDLLVIVFLISGREIGMLATAPVDVTEVSVRFDESTLIQPGIMGSAIIEDHTTQMVDIFSLVEAVNPDWFVEGERTQDIDGKAPTILYAEDSTFFRTQVKGVLEEAGYRVIDAEDGMIAWDLLQEHADEISLVVTDIEMPNLDGIGLSRKIREQYSHLPIISLTTLASDEEIARGKEAGIDDYQIKLDRESLLESVKNFLGESK